MSSPDLIGESLYGILVSGIHFGNSKIPRLFLGLWGIFLFEGILKFLRLKISQILVGF